MRRELPDEAIESVAAWLRVIAEPTRIRLMECLNGGGGSAQALAAQLGMSRQNVSQHLEVLRQARIVSRCRAGNRVRYELADFSGWWVVEQVTATIAAPSSRPAASTAQLHT
jgi:DNA-binding transcriptional ArsR family regulator